MTNTPSSRLLAAILDEPQPCGHIERFIALMAGQSVRIISGEDAGAQLTGEPESCFLVFDLIVQLCLGTGQDAKNKVLEFVVDDRWRFAMNGKDRAIAVAAKDGRMGVDLKPYEVAAWFNGWLAGIIDPFGGVLANGAAANEETFVEALKACAAKRGVELKGG